MVTLEAQVDAFVHLAKEIPLNKAFSGPNSSSFIEAYKKEVKSILKHTAKPIPKDHPEHNVAIEEAVSSRFIANEKRDGRAKFRWVVQGCFKSCDLDDWTNHAHVATLDAFRSMIFRHDRKSRTLASVDIRTAFLQSELYGPNERARYIKVKDPFSGEWLYFRLLGPMYGQRSAPRRWEDTLAPWLESQGFQRGENEPSVFYRASDDTTILVYVDDLLIDGDDASVKQFLLDLKNKFECNQPVFLTQENPIDFIGIIISLTATKIQLSMEPYCNKFLNDMGMADCNPRGTPFQGVDIDKDSLALDIDQSKYYRSGCGGLGWLVSTLRPDCAYAFSKLGSFMSKPNKASLRALKHTLQYIQGTKHYKLSMDLDQGNSNGFTFFVDFNHGVDKSQTGRIGLQNKVPTSWKSKTQSATSLSSTEAEVYAASVATQDFQHLSYVVDEIGIRDFPSPFPLHIDNAACIIFMEDSSRVSRLKHIDRRQNWCQQMRDGTIVQPVKVDTNENLADLLTKALPRPKIEYFVNQIFDTSK